jgi:hypothetical protein
VSSRPALSRAAGGVIGICDRPLRRRFAGQAVEIVIDAADRPAGTSS